MSCRPPGVVHEGEFRALHSDCLYRCSSCPVTFALISGVFGMCLNEKIRFWLVNYNEYLVLGSSTILSYN